MKVLDPFPESEWWSTRNTSLAIMRYMDGTCYYVRPFVTDEDSGFSRKRTDELIEGIIEYLPKNCGKKVRIYKDYLFMALTLAYVQSVIHDEVNCTDDIIYDAGLGNDTCFSGVINRALVDDSFLVQRYGTKLVTGVKTDLDGYLEHIYEYRRKHPGFDRSDMYHPVFAGIGAIVDILNGREYDDRLDRHSSEEHFNEFKRKFPCKRSFVNAYNRYKENYFVTGMRDDLQANIEKAVKSYLISCGLSQYDEDPDKDRVRILLEKTERRIANLI